jgi:hypothetical protein
MSEIDKVTTTPIRCACDGIICCRSRPYPKKTNVPNAKVMMYFCQTCGMMYDTIVMERRKAEYVSPIEDLIMTAALEANKALEENPDASLAEIGAASKANFVISIPPVKKKGGAEED